MSYMYAVARLRAMENRFLDGAFFTRLIECVTLEEALKSLGETVYGQWIAGGALSFDKVIDAELVATCKDLEQFVPDKRLLDIYRMPHDFNNVKVILKSVFKAREGGERRHDLLSTMGAIDTETLVLAIEGEEYGFLPYGLTDVIPHAWSVWEQTKSARDAELIIDDCLFTALKKVASELKIPEIIRWVEHKIDAENIGSALRLSRLNVDPATVRGYFHKGGTISPDDASRLLSEPLESWGKSLSHTSFGAIFDSIQDRSDTQAVLCDVSKALSASLIEVLNSARYKSEAPENILLYLLQKDEEAKNLRIALVCVANGLNREFARRLLSHGR
ncbi:ATPase [Synergistales bacterium]|nr:ATPase [Synergistales bacterium]